MDARWFDALILTPEHEMRLDQRIIPLRDRQSFLGGAHDDDDDTLNTGKVAKEIFD